MAYAGYVKKNGDRPTSSEKYGNRKTVVATSRPASSAKYAGKLKRKTTQDILSARERAKEISAKKTQVERTRASNLKRQ